MVHDKRLRHICPICRSGRVRKTIVYYLLRIRPDVGQWSRTLRFSTDCFPEFCKLIGQEEYCRNPTHPKRPKASWGPEFGGSRIKKPKCDFSHLRLRRVSDKERKRIGGTDRSRGRARLLTRRRRLDCNNLEFDEIIPLRRPNVEQRRVVRLHQLKAPLAIALDRAFDNRQPIRQHPPVPERRRREVSGNTATALANRMANDVGSGTGTNSIAAIPGMGAWLSIG